MLNIELVMYSRELPELLDVRITATNPRAFTLMEFERVARVECAQSWLVAECSRPRLGDYCRSSAIGQLQTVSVTVQFTRNQPFASESEAPLGHMVCLNS